MQIIKLVMGPVEANCYIVYIEGQEEAIVIDPGSYEISPIIEKLNEKGLSLRAIFLTHGHFDHILGVDKLREETGAKVHIHLGDKDCLTDESKNLSTYMGGGYSFAPADVILKDSDKITIGQMEINVIHTPGHTPGGVSYLINGVLFTGDTLFAGSVGRTDLPMGSYETLMKSIEKRILVLDPAMKIYPGHNEDSTIGIEINTNPFL